jgi:hypothetical protein
VDLIVCPPKPLVPRRNVHGWFSRNRDPLIVAFLAAAAVVVLEDARTALVEVAPGVGHWLARPVQLPLAVWLALFLAGVVVVALEVSRFNRW